MPEKTEPVSSVERVEKKNDEVGEMSLSWEIYQRGKCSNYKK
jgi:hypothetical protein